MQANQCSYHVWIWAENGWKTENLARAVIAKSALVFTNPLIPSALFSWIANPCKYYHEDMCGMPFNKHYISDLKVENCTVGKYCNPKYGHFRTNVAHFLLVKTILSVLLPTKVAQKSPRQLCGLKEALLNIDMIMSDRLTTNKSSMPSRRRACYRVALTWGLFDLMI